MVRPAREACYRAPCNHQNQGVRPSADLHVFFDAFDPIAGSHSEEMVARHISYRPTSKEPADQSISACTWTAEMPLLRLVDICTSADGGELM